MIDCPKQAFSHYPRNIAENTPLCVTTVQLYVTKPAERANRSAYMTLKRYAYVSFVPQFEQNFAPTAMTSPQLLHFSTGT